MRGNSVEFGGGIRGTPYIMHSIPLANRPGHSSHKMRGIWMAIFRGDDPNFRKLGHVPEIIIDSLNILSIYSVL